LPTIFATDLPGISYSSLAKGPRDENGNILTGKLGREINIDEGYRRARLVGLGLLAAMRDALGSLDRVDFVVKLLGMVNAEPNFNDSPKIVNGCSGLFVEVFGDAGRHARSAVGNAMLPDRCRSKSRASSRLSKNADPGFGRIAQFVVTRSIHVTGKAPA
jgi:enamine deaminase RidA (YjgF/YER057c/UK114 family)